MLFSINFPIATDDSTCIRGSSKSSIFTDCELSQLTVGGGSPDTEQAKVAVVPASTS